MVLGTGLSSGPTARLAPPLHTWRGGRGWGWGRSERHRDAALPGDVVLDLVEPVAVELVDEVATLRADTEAPEAVLEPRAEVAGELGPRAVGAELMDANGAHAAKYIRDDGAGARTRGIAQHQVGIIGELVELAATGEGGAADAVLRPATARADADVLVQPRGRVDRADPAESPIGCAGLVEMGRARQAAERAAHGHAVEARPPRHMRCWTRGAACSWTCGTGACTTTPTPREPSRCRSRLSRRLRARCREARYRPIESSSCTARDRMRAQAPGRRER